jgi:YbbR domain-containing protein
VAILIWLTINSNMENSFKLPETHSSSTLSRSLPVTARKPPADARGFVFTPREVEVTIRGDERILDNLKMSDVDVCVNLLDVTDARSFRRKVVVHTPQNVAVMKVTPEEITVERISLPETTNSVRMQN